MRWDIVTYKTLLKLKSDSTEEGPIRQNTEFTALPLSDWNKASEIKLSFIRVNVHLMVIKIRRNDEKLMVFILVAHTT